MIKIITLFILVTQILSAKSYLLSSLSIPKSEIIDIDTKECSEQCLNRHLIEGRVFSFLAKFKSLNIFDNDLKNKFLKYNSLMNLDKELTVDFKIAILFPQKKIGKYALNSTKAILAYLLSEDKEFNIETFDSEDESTKNINLALKRVKERDFRHIIAIYTLEGAKVLAQNSEEFKIYIPTVNVNDLDINSTQNSNIVFGGIDYKRQIDKLREFTNSKVLSFYDKSPVSRRLTSYIERNFENSQSKEIESKNQNFRALIRNRDTNYASIFLNTPVVTSSLLMSQISYYQKKVHKILSTQINYSPLILSITQKRDTEKLLIANSISNIENSNLEDSNRLLGNDISYDWINYSISYGVDYLVNQISNEEVRLFSENIFNNQVLYNIELVKVEDSKFQPINQ